MEILNASSLLTVNPDVVYTKIDDDVVMMGPKDGLYYGMNSVGAVIWQLLESKPMSLAALYESVQKDYDVDEAQCIADTSNFINEMIVQKIVLVV